MVDHKKQPTLLLAMKKWHTVYTHPRMGKQVPEHLDPEEIEVYLPLQKRMNYWRGRERRVEKGYLTSCIPVPKITLKKIRSVVALSFHMK